MNFDLLTIGDYSLDVILTLPQTGKDHVDHQPDSVCFLKEEKILTKDLQISLGGNSLNTAVGMSRLGFNVTLVTFVGDDFTAGMLKKTAETEKIDLTFSFHQTGMLGNYSTTIFADFEKTIFVHNHPNTYSLPEHLSPTKMVYLSSVGPDYAGIFSETVSHCNSNKIPLVFNPASHQFNDAYDKYKIAVENSSYLFVNKKEAQKILRADIFEIKDLLRELKKLGSKTVIITDNTNGAYSYDGQTAYYCPAYDLPVVQKTGAGDAFSSGFLSAILSGKGITEAMFSGSINAASVIADTGPLSGLLTKERMEKIISASPLPVVKIL